MGACSNCCLSRILHPKGWEDVDLARVSWSQVSFGIYLPVDRGILLTGSVWSPFEIPQGMQAEGYCSALRVVGQAGCWNSGRG